MRIHSNITRLSHLITTSTHHVPNVHHPKAVPLCATCVYPMVVFALILVLIAVGLVVRRVVWWRNNVQLEKEYAKYAKYAKYTKYVQYIELASQEKDDTNTTTSYPATSVLI